MLPTTDKERKALPIFTFLTQYFPDAVVAMVNVAVQGNIQHNPELAPADIKWARGKSTDQLNTAMRHLWDHGTGTERDSDGQYHLAKAAWRILAQLQLTIEDAQLMDEPDVKCTPDDEPIEGGLVPARGIPFEEGGLVPSKFPDAMFIASCKHGRLICAVCKFP
jgi:hypothetical protein